VGINVDRALCSVRHTALCLKASQQNIHMHEYYVQRRVKWIIRVFLCYLQSLLRRYWKKMNKIRPTIKVTTPYNSVPLVSRIAMHTTVEFNFRTHGKKSETHRPRGRPRYRWEDNIKINFQGIGCGAWIGLIWLKTGKSDGLFWTRWWTLMFRCVIGISRLAEELFASQGLCSMNLVI